MMTVHIETDQRRQSLIILIEGFINVKKQNGFACSAFTDYCSNAANLSVDAFLEEVKEYEQNRGTIHP